MGELNQQEQDKKKWNYAEVFVETEGDGNCELQVNSSFVSSGAKRIILSPKYDSIGKFLEEINTFLSPYLQMEISYQLYLVRILMKQCSCQQYIFISNL